MTLTNFAGQNCEAGVLVLPDSITFIGGSAFQGCSSIVSVVLPEGVTTIGYNAFSGCKGITSVTLPASLTGLDITAFSDSGLERYAVAEGNQYYSTDSWGVLYNVDKTTLIQYPACRSWPYYNVDPAAVKIASNAFSGCEKLVNLYIPNNVTQLYSSAIDRCPYLTVCCHIGSAAYNYAISNGLTAWYMDNKTLQGISVYALPEQSTQVQGQVNLQGLYIVGDYEGKELQIDDYTLNYDQQTTGVKTVTVSYQGKTVTFEMVLFVSAEGNIISFQCDSDLDGKTVMIAVYDQGGKMLVTKNAVILDGKAQIGVSESVYQSADHAKLFVMDEVSFAPTAEVQEQIVS